MPLIKKYTFVLCLLLAFASLGYHRYHYRAFYPDTALQLQSDHFLQQKGVTGYYQVRPENKWEILFTPLKAFPPGYTYMLYGAYLLFPNPILAILGLDFTGIFLFTVSSLLIFSHSPFRFNAWILFTAYCTVSISLLHPLPASDLICLGLFTLSIYLLLSSVHRDKGSLTTFLILFMSSGLLGLTAYIKFLYLAFLPTIPLAVFTYAWIKRKRNFLYRALVFSFLPFSMLLFSLSRWWFEKSVPYFPEREVFTIYPSHLLHFDAFPLKSFMYFNQNIVDTFSSMLSIPDIVITIIILLASFSVLLICVSSWYNWMQKASTIRYNFAGILFPIILGSNIAILVYSSLTTSPETDWLDFWTFVMETRYYAPSQWIILMTVLLLSVDKTRKYLSLGSKLMVYTSITISLIYLLLNATIPAFKNDKPLFPDYNYQKLYHLTDSIMQSSHTPLIYTTNGARIPEAAGAIYIEADSLANYVLPSEDTLRLMIVWDKTQSGEIRLKYLDKSKAFNIVHNHPYWSLYVREFCP